MALQEAAGRIEGVGEGELTADGWKRRDANLGTSSICMKSIL